MAEPLPAAAPLTLYRGDTRVWTVDLVSDPDTDDEAPVDLTGHEFLSTVRVSRDRSARVLADLAVVVDGDPADGRLVLTLTADEADGLALTADEAGPPWWDLQLTRTSDGFRRTYLSGKVKLLSDVSHEEESS